MEKRFTPKNTKKKTQKCYNYKIKGHLAKNYRKSKTGTGSQKK